MQRCLEKPWPARAFSATLTLVRGLLVSLLVATLPAAASAQGVGVPSSRWGIGFGNSPEFSGLRFNFRDRRVKRVTGVNLTLWQPHDDDADSTITGLSLGPLAGGGTMRGLQVGIFGLIGMKRLVGVNVATLGMGAGGDIIGINLGGLGIGAGGRLVGLNVGGLGAGSGGGMTGINVGGLGVGTGGDLSGINVGGLGVGAGGTVSGINVAALGIGAGRSLNGLNIAGLAVGAPTARGLSIAGVVGGQSLIGVHVGVASVHAICDGRMVGLAVSPFNYIKGTMTGIAIGVVNYAWSVRGAQIGLVNIVRDNPTPLKVLPVFNTSF